MNLAKPSQRERRWTAIPAARSSAPILKLRLALVLGSLIGAAMFGLFGGIAWLTSRPDPPEPPPPTPKALGFAAEVANAWLEGRTIALPVANGVDPSFGGTSSDGRVGLNIGGTVSWTGFRLLEPVPGRTIELHQFILGGPAPRLLVIPVELTKSGPVLTAAPALESLPVAASGGGRFDYTDRDNRKDLTDDVKRVASEWMKAYAADDRSRLRELTGDPKPRVYAGLGGLTAKSVSAVSALPSPVDGMWVVRVSATLTNDEGFVGTGEWDLLIKDPTTANPNVVAWGPAGLGLYLEPYENGVTGPSQTTAQITTTAPRARTEAEPTDGTP